jgi:hypothetical protein
VIKKPIAKRKSVSYSGVQRLGLADGLEFYKCEPGNLSPIGLQNTKHIEMLIRERSHWTKVVKRIVADDLFVCQHRSKPMLTAADFE